MGFYSPDQLIQDVRRHGVEVRPVDVTYSDWFSTLEPVSSNTDTACDKPEGYQAAIRLGMHRVRGFNREAGERIVSARDASGFNDLRDLARRATLRRDDIEHLAAANALRTLGGHRYQAHWQTQAIEEPRPLLESKAQYQHNPLDDGIALQAPGESQDMLADYHSTGLTLGRHPMLLLRADYPFSRCRRESELQTLRHGCFIRVAGLVTGRQRPGSAAGVLFLTLEDETGNINIVVWKDVQQRCRKALLGGSLLLVKGVLERRDGVAHIIAGDLIDYSERIASLSIRSRSFR